MDIRNKRKCNCELELGYNNDDNMWYKMENGKWKKIGKMAKFINEDCMSDWGELELWVNNCVCGAIINIEMNCIDGDLGWVELEAVKK